MVQVLGARVSLLFLVWAWTAMISGPLMTLCISVSVPRNLLVGSGLRCSLISLVVGLVSVVPVKG